MAGFLIKDNRLYDIEDIFIIKEDMMAGLFPNDCPVYYLEFIENELLDILSEEERLFVKIRYGFPED